MAIFLPSTLIDARFILCAQHRKAEHKDFDKLSRSGTRRFFVRVKAGGKEGLEKRLEKEEREYIEAAQAEHNESIALADLKRAADDARAKVSATCSAFPLRAQSV